MRIADYARIRLSWDSIPDHKLPLIVHGRKISSAFVDFQENMVVLFSDLTMHELKVLPRDLQLCTDMATGVDSLGQFQFGDMVQIDPQTVGVIVQIQKENFQVDFFPLFPFYPLSSCQTFLASHFCTDLLS